MPDHSAVRRTEELRGAAESLSALRLDDFTAADDPVAILRNLHATLRALHQVWPEISIAAGFEDPFGDDASEFTDDIERGLRLAEDGLLNAVEAPRAEGGPTKLAGGGAPCFATFREDPMPDTAYCGEKGPHSRHTAWDGPNYYAWLDGDEGAGSDPMQ